MWKKGANISKQVWIHRTIDASMAIIPKLNVVRLESSGISQELAPNRTIQPRASRNSGITSHNDQMCRRNSAKTDHAPETTPAAAAMRVSQRTGADVVKT